MTRLIRTSDVETVNDIRKILWEKIYSNFSHMNFFIQCIKNNLPYQVGMDFDFIKMQITMEITDETIDNEIIKKSIEVAYKDFASHLFSASVIDKQMYDLCLDSASMLTNFLRFGNNAKITL